MKTSDYKSFNYLENGDVLFSPFETVKSVSKLQSGIYEIVYHWREESLSLKEDRTFETSKVINFPDKEKIESLLEAFFNPEVKYKIEQLGFCHKLGILLYGKEGTGKSTILKNYYTDSVIKNNALVFYFTNTDDSSGSLSTCWEFIQNIRKIQDNP